MSEFQNDVKGLVEKYGFDHDLGVPSYILAMAVRESFEELATAKLL